VLPSQHEHQMVEIVFGKYRYGPLGRETSIKQGLSDAFHCREHLRVSKPPPFAAWFSLSRTDPFRKLLGPMGEAIGKNLRIRAKRFIRSHTQCSVGQLFNRRSGRPEAHLADASAFSSVLHAQGILSVSQIHRFHDISRNGFANPRV
jgi:hypothetical protein